MAAFVIIIVVIIIISPTGSLADAGDAAIT
jgi:hypothetical protein